MKWINNLLKGLAISISTLVPGVSGGTMAIILGVYDDIIHAIGSFTEDWRKHTKLLFQIGMGGVAGVLLFSKIIENALNSFPMELGFLFMGVVAGGLPVIYKKSISNGRNNRDYLWLVIGLGLALLMMMKPEAVADMTTLTGITRWIVLFISGGILAVALILPGISGSFMLLVLGLYEITLNAINNFDIEFLIPIGIGAVVATLATTKGIEKLLQKYPSKTYMLILGFIIGSIFQIYPGLPEGGSLILSLIAAALGFALMIFIGRNSSKLS